MATFSFDLEFNLDEQHVEGFYAVEPQPTTAPDIKHGFVPTPRMQVEQLFPPMNLLDTAPVEHPAAHAGAVDGDHPRQDGSPLPERGGSSLPKPSGGKRGSCVDDRDAAQWQGRRLSTLSLAARFGPLLRHVPRRGSQSRCLGPNTPHCAGGTRRIRHQAAVSISHHTSFTSMFRA